MMPGNGVFGNIDMEGSSQVQHHQRHPFMLQQNHHSLSQRQPSVQPTIPEDFPLTIGTMQTQDQSISLADFGKGEKSKCVSDEDEPSLNEDAADGHAFGGKLKKAIPWQRVKWTDAMVRLLITAVSYIGEEASAEYGGGARRKYIHMQKKGKWKSVSKVMAERGHFVSPQQCEDKFNDLNKRYKRLNEILGRGTTCEVVENPALLDMMDHVSDKAKEEVRKILSSKHLHYEEMCSYHNGNRLHLPPDPELQRSLRLALRSRDDPEESGAKRHINDDNDDDDQDVEFDDYDDYEENHGFHEDRMTHGIPGGSVKRLRPSSEDVAFGNSLHSSDTRKHVISQPQSNSGEDNQLSPEGLKGNILQKQNIEHRSHSLKQQKLQIKAQKLELEREKFKWEVFSRKKDRELDKMKQDNERMKLENKRIELELKRREFDLRFQ